MRPKANRGTFIQRSRHGATPEQKALYHHSLGAGRSQVKRAFFGVSDAELTAIGARVEAFVAQRLGRITAAGG